MGFPSAMLCPKDDINRNGSSNVLRESVFRKCRGQLGENEGPLCTSQVVPSPSPPPPAQLLTHQSKVAPLVLPVQEKQGKDVCWGAGAAQKSETSSTSLRPGKNLRKTNSKLNESQASVTSLDKLADFFFLRNKCVQRELMPPSSELLRCSRL